MDVRSVGEVGGKGSGGHCNLERGMKKDMMVADDSWGRSSRA